MRNAILLPLAAALLFATPAWAAELRAISMPGHGVVKAAPNQVQINAGGSTSAPTAAQALTANTARMKGVFDALQIGRARVGKECPSKDRKSVV